MLLTGFQSYGGRSINPAEEIVKALDGEVIEGELVIGRTLPVDYDELRPRIEQLIKETEPRAVICLGLWPGEAMIRLERIASNIADFEIADNSGTIINESIIPDGPTGLASTLPLKVIRDAILAAKIPVRISGTAGQFLCNAVMYQALNCCATIPAKPDCGFIHLPYLPEQVVETLREISSEAKLERHQRADLASMSLHKMIDAVSIAIKATLKESSR